MPGDAGSAALQGGSMLLQFRATILPGGLGRIAIYGDDDDEHLTVCCTVSIDTLRDVRHEHSIDGRDALQYVKRHLEKFGHAMTAKYRQHRESFKPLAQAPQILQGTLTIEDLLSSGERFFTHRIGQKTKI
jgi:hypothetical protein